MTIHRTGLRAAWLLLATAAMAVLVFVACGDDDDDDNGGEHDATGEVVATAGDIEVIAPFVRETVNDTAAVYLDLRSTGGTDRLIAARANVGTDWQIHEVVEEGGSSSMRPVENGIEVPAGEHVHLEPGGYHIMLLGLEEPLEPGDEVEVKLTFEQGGEVSFAVPVHAFADGDNGEDEHAGH